MSANRLPAVILVGVVLTIMLVAGNLVFAAHASVLDPGFVTNAIEEEDGYDVLTEEMQRSVEDAMSAASEGGLGGGSFGEIIDGNPIQDAVTPAYVQSQVDPNVREIYAYLHGSSSTLNLTMDTRPLAERAGENVGESIRNATVSELVDAAPGDPFADVPVDASFVEKLNESPSSYRTAKEDLRNRVRDRVLDRLVQEAFTERSNDELLALVIPDYDPRDYTEEEKERMVADRESEIRDALRNRIEQEDDGQIAEAIDDQYAAIRENASQMQPTADQVGSQAIADAAGDMQTAVVTAATTDQSYEAYRAEVTSARSDLATAVDDYVVGQINQEAGVVDLNEQLNIGQRGEFGSAKSIVGIVDISAIAIPILALLLIAGIWLLSRSAMVTSATVGTSLVVAAIPGVVGAPIAGDRIRSMVEIEGESASSMEPIINGIIDRVVGTISGQSMLVALLGIVLVAVAVALHYGAAERARAMVQAE